MAVGAATALMIGSTAFSAASSFLGGRQEAKAISQAADFNAGLYEQQAQLVQQQKKIVDYQYGRRIGKMRSTVVSQTAGKGLDFTGTPLAVMADTESQMLFDQAIEKYNLDVQKNYYQHAAAMTRYQGSLEAGVARRQGYMNAFSTILNAGASFAGGLGGSSPFARKPDIFTSAGPGYRRY